MCGGGGVVKGVYICIRDSLWGVGGGREEDVDMYKR